MSRSENETVPVAAPLERVWNFRTFDTYTVETADGVCSLRSGRLFRAANLHQATEKDATFLCASSLSIGGGSATPSGTGLKTIVDLRSRDEQRKDFLHPDASKRGHLIGQFTPVDSRTQLVQGKVVMPETDETSTSATRHLITVPLLGSEELFKCVFALAPWWRKLLFFLLALCRGTRRSFEIVLYPVFCNGMKLDDLYRFMLSDKNCQARIVKVLHACARAENHPLVFHCTHGKDRTGMIAMLLLLALGVDEETIISDYAATETLVPHEELATSLPPEMDPKIWACTPASAMRSTLRFLHSKYGSSNAYLDLIGFGDEWRRRLRACMLQ